MTRFRMGTLSEHLTAISEQAERFTCKVRCNEPISNEDIQDSVNTLNELYKFLYGYQFGAASFNRTQHAESYFTVRNEPLTAGGSSAEMRSVKQTLIDDINAEYFLWIQRGREGFVDNPKLLGEQVVESFPSAKEDIIEAGNCIAADCNTAAVFHLMRVVEWGLRALCQDLRLLTLRKSKKSGKTKYSPIEYATWEDILNQLHAKVDKRLEKLSRGSLKQKEQQFYYPALQEIRALRDAWRNHVTHTRAFYGREDTDAVLAHVKRLMSNLSSRLKEV